MALGLDSKHVVGSPKSSLIGLAVALAPIIQNGLTFSETGHFAMTPQKWVFLGIAAFIATVQFLSPDADKTPAATPDNPEPHDVDAHATPDDPSATPVKG